MNKIVEETPSIGSQSAAQNATPPSANPRVKHKASAKAAKSAVHHVKPNAAAPVAAPAKAPKVPAAVDDVADHGGAAPSTPPLESPDPFDWVERAHAAGWSFTPADGNKKPLIVGWASAPRETIMALQVWSRQGNLGVRTGSISGGIVVVDMDKGADQKVVKRLLKHKTVTVLTGSRDPATGERGRHLYFRCNKKIRNSVGKLAKGIDIRAEGGQALTSGSKNAKTGMPYEFAPGLGFDDVEVAELPPWVLKKIAVDDEPQDGEGVQSEQEQCWLDAVPIEERVRCGELIASIAPSAVSGRGGHDATFSVACQLASGCWLPHKQALDCLKRFNKRCKPQWTEPELRHKIDDAIAKRPKDGAECGSKLGPAFKAVLQALGASAELKKFQSRPLAVIKRGEKETQVTVPSPGAKAESTCVIKIRSILPELDRAFVSAMLDGFRTQLMNTETSATEGPTVFEMAKQKLAETSDEIRERATRMGRSPDLAQIIMDDVQKLGVMDLSHHSVLIYIVATSRLMPNPLAVQIRGHLGSGKSLLGDTIAQLMPPEGVKDATDMSPRALFYVPAGSLRHRVVVAGERPREDGEAKGEGTRALREFLSRGKITQMAVASDEFGLRGVERSVEGPIAYIQSTTQDEIFAEDLSRMLEAWIEPSAEERVSIARAVLRGETSVAASIRREIIDRHHAFQRSLQPLDVFAGAEKDLEPLLSMHEPSNPDYVRRVVQAQTLVSAIAFLHQHQRTRDAEGRIVAGRADVDLALTLLREVSRVVAGSESSAAAQAIAALAVAVRNNEFTAADLAAIGDVSVRSAKRWIGKPAVGGPIREVSPPKGPKPATYVFTEAFVTSMLALTEKSTTPEGSAQPADASAGVGVVADVAASTEGGVQ